MDSSPTLYRVSPPVYDRMVASGALDDEPVELVNGLLIEVSPQGPEHAALVQWLTARLAARGDLLRVHLPLQAPTGRPEPDLALARSDSAYRHPTSALLAVEIAVTSWEADISKLHDYAAAGVPVVWLINVRERAVHVFTDPGDDAYATERVLRAGGTLDAAVDGVPEIAVSELFAVLDR